MARQMTDVLRGMSVDEVRQRARRDAQSVLAEFWKPDVLPVDPVSVARALGLSVYASDLANDVWGMLVGNVDGAEIYVEQDQPRSRFRFSCAHEIGHYVLRADDLTPRDAFIDKRSTDGSDSRDEIYANEFAGSLLMPEAALRAAVNERVDDFTLMRRFAVSMPALKYRRRLLGF